MPKKPSRQQASKQKRAGEPEDLSARATGKAAAAAGASAAQPQMTFEDAIDAVEQMIEQSDLDAAEQALRSQYLVGNLRPGDINSIHAGLTPALELLAQVLIGKQKTKEAFQWLTQCCKLQPDGGSEKWMYYGQLIGGREALEAFKRGIACMFKTRAAIMEKGQHETQKRVDPLSVPFTMADPVVETPAQLSQQLASLSKQISSGYTSMAELFVTDLCDEEGAEAECEKLLQLALQNCPTNPDALYALANLRTIQQREPEACQVMEKLFEALQQCRAASIENMSVLALADDQANDDVPHTIHLADVSYELRVAAAKLAFELQAVQPALDLLEQLLEEDDRILEVSHLAAVCAFHLGRPDVSLEHIARAEDFLSMDQPQEVDMAEEEEEADPVHAEDLEKTRHALAELKAQALEAVKHMPAPAEGEAEDEAEEGEAEEEQKNGGGDDMED
jgi:tetratricopeptide (TPR) repeat protein